MLASIYHTMTDPSWVSIGVITESVVLGCGINPIDLVSYVYIYNYIYIYVYA